MMHQSGDNDTTVLESEGPVPVQKVRVMLLFFLTNLKGFKIEYRSGTRGILSLNLNEIFGSLSLFNKKFFYLSNKIKKIYL